MRIGVTANVGAVRNDAASAEVASLRTEDALPIRQFYAWPGKRNYEGLWWSSTTRRHVEFESLLEREYLLAADATVDVVAVAAQPLALLWPHGTPGERNHVPDFFVRLASGAVASSTCGPRTVWRRMRRSSR